MSRTIQVGNETFILEGGRYRPANRLEQEALQRPTSQVAGEAAVTSFMDLVGMAAKAGIVPNAATAAGQLPQARAMAERTAEAETVRPYATALGADAPYAGLELLGLGTAGRGGRAARRALQQRAQPSQNTDTLADLGAMAQTFGADTAGAASRGQHWEAMKRVPKFKGMLESLEQFIGTSRPMSPAAQKVMDDGMVGRFELELLPGQANGNGVIAEIISRDPLMADAFDGVRARNSERFMRRLSGSLGLNPADMVGADLRGNARASIGELFDEVAGFIGEFKPSDEVKEVLGRVMSTSEREAFEEVGERIGGVDAMDARRYIADELASVRQAGGLASEVRQLENALDAIDEQIRGAMTDDHAMALWTDARQRWRLVRALDRAGSVEPGTGDLSIKSFVNNLEREFKKEYGRSFYAKGDHLPQDVKNLLDHARTARSFMSNLNDSGTGTTNTLLQAMNNPMTFAKKRIAARFITDVVMNDPYRANRLPGADELLE